MTFLPNDPKKYEQAKLCVESVAANQGHEILGWRSVPTNNAELGESAIKTEPKVEQFFVTRATTDSAIKAGTEQQMYILRKQIGRAHV